MSRASGVKRLAPCALPIPRGLEINALTKTDLTNALEFSIGFHGTGEPSDLASVILNRVTSIVLCDWALLGQIHNNTYIRLTAKKGSQPNPQTPFDIPLNTDLPNQSDRLPFSQLYKILPDQSLIFVRDNAEYIDLLDDQLRQRGKYIFCFPIQLQASLVGVIYLDLASPKALTRKAITQLNLLAKHVAPYLIIKTAEHKVDGIYTTPEETDNHPLFRVLSEIRTQISSIIGFSRILQTREFKTLRETNRYARNITNSGEDLLEIIRNIQCSMNDTEACPQTGDQWLDPKLILVHGYHAFYKKAADRDIELTYDLHSQVPRKVYTNRYSLIQLLMEALSLSVGITRPGSHVEAFLDFSDDQLSLSIHSEKINSTAYFDSIQVESHTSLPHLKINLSKFEQLQAFAQSVSGDCQYAVIGDSATLKLLISAPCATCANISELKRLLNDRTHFPIGSEQVMSENPAQSPDLMENFQELLKIPIFKGGSSRKLIHKMKKSYTNTDNHLLDLLDQLETIIYQGDQNAYQTLIKKALGKSSRLTKTSRH